MSAFVWSLYGNGYHYTTIQGCARVGMGVSCGGASQGSTKFLINSNGSVSYLACDHVIMMVKTSHCRSGVMRIMFISTTTSLALSSKDASKKEKDNAT